MGEHNPPPYLVRSQRKGPSSAGKAETFALVPIPSEPGRYVRTHPSVLEVACPQCGAKLREPCRRKPAERGQIIRIWHGRAIVIETSRTRHRAAAHAARVHAAGRRRRLAVDGQEPAQDRQTTLALVDGAESA